MSGLFLPGFAIHRPTQTDDGKGGKTAGFALSSTVEGRLSSLSAGQTPRAMQERGIVTLRFATPSDTDIKPDDEIRKGGRTAVVQAVAITSTGRRKECVCEEINAG